jgi:putative membrane protein
MSRISTAVTREQEVQHSGSPNKTSGSHMRPKERKETVTGTISTWSRPFVLAHRIPVFKRVWIYVALMGVYTLAVDWIAGQNFPSNMIKEVGAVSFGGIILGLLLVFRTNSAYERWWEGRKLWGQLVNDSRNICLKIRSIRAIKNDDKVQFGELVISFSYALKHHLRGTKPADPLPGVGTLSEHDDKNIPVYITSKMYDMLMRWHREGNIDIMMLNMLDEHARSFMNISGGCERIKNSPIAISYRAFMRQGIALNLLALPWYLAQQFSMCWCLPLILISTYFLIGIELIAEDIEDPFGYDGDDLPLDNLCANIKATITNIVPVQEDLRFTQSLSLPNLDLLKP